MAQTTVDLDEPELYRKIGQRYDLLARIADDLTYGTEHLFNPNEVNYNPDAVIRAVEAYFLLSEAYKVARLRHSADDIRRTKNAKKAGLTALAIFALEPFRLINASAPPLTTVSTLANLMFALEFGATVLNRSFSHLTRAMQLRLFRFLDGQHLQSLGEYVSVQMLGRRARRYTVDITPDLAVIEMTILFFELHGLGEAGDEDD